MVLNFFGFVSVALTAITSGFSNFFESFHVETNDLIIGGIIILVSFFATVFLTRKWIKSAKASELQGKDMNKPDKPLVPRSGGLIVAIVVCFSVLIYVFLKTFSMLGTPQAHVVETFALSSTILLAGFIGFIDDILGWKTGLGQMQKIFLTIPIALPLTVLKVDFTVMVIPFLGSVDLGILYPLLIVPLGIIGATNGFNLLAGYNGLEASMGLVIFATFGLTSILVGRLWLALICMIVYASLLGFLAFNWYPSKVFPGNSFSYAIGALIGTLAILGNMERIAVWLFMLYFLEILLYMWARFIDKQGDVQAFAKVNEDGSLDLPYKHIYDTTHLAIWVLKKLKTKVYEKDVVLFIVAVQIVIAVLGLLLIV